MNNLQSIFYNSEKEYIEEFCKEYKDPIKTPDGFIVLCQNIKQKAYHFCEGSVHKFQRRRAQRILYPKYIFLYPEERVILKNQNIKNKLFFFFYRKRNSYLIICRIMNKNKLDLDLTSGYPIFGKKIKDLLGPNPPYKFYQK